MITYFELEQRGVGRLRECLMPTPDIDARFLLQEASGLTRAQLILRRNDVCPEPHLQRYDSLVARRLAGEPVGRILGKREFWGLDFSLSKDTLEPRPDSETLIEAVLAHRPDRRKAYSLCDFGTGTGCLLGAVLHSYPNAQGVGVDISRGALLMAQKNLTALGLGRRASFALGDWGDAQGIRGKQFDIILSNPPYVPSDAVLDRDVRDYDPERALFAGKDGLAAYRRLVPSLPAFLASDGLVVLEIGVGQCDAVVGLAEASGLKTLEIREDLGGIARAVVLGRA